jgi:chaperone modulatory protein CbpM
MITMERLFIEIESLNRDDLDRWIAEHLLRPQSADGTLLFHDIDLARLRLIILLRDELDIAEPALPTILSLLDQLYDLRRQIRRLNEAVEHTIPPEIRTALLLHLQSAAPETPN